MPTEADIVTAAAQQMCVADGRGIKVADVWLHGQGYTVNIAVPKQPGMSDEDWHSVVEDMRTKLLLVAGVERVTVDIARSA